MNDLKRLRQSRKLSQIEASKLLNVSRRTYQKYEAMEDNFNEKYNFLVYRLNELTKIDENNGLLTIDFIKNEVGDILKNYNVKSCFLFGSYAKGKATSKSDVDLLIDSDITGLDFYGLIEELRIKLNKKIDLLTINSISNNPTMLVEILKDGIKIYG